ncbi:MAG: tetratricopeptide repeat protein [Paracoccaceae bacterium]
MSDSDSFIDEVTEELRRDQLFRLIRRYGWIAILLVLILVGGAAFNEVRKSRAASAAQTMGDRILAALMTEDPTGRAAALRKIEAEGDQATVLALLQSGEEIGADDADAAAEPLRQIAMDPNQPAIYRHLAEFKLILIQGDSLPPAERLARLESLATPGAPFRLLAEEQMALTEISAGNDDAAMKRLQSILADGEVTAGLRRRVSQLIVALGGELEPA